ncbi:MAG: hypothetical protein MJZ45_04105 [Bacteroidales bacterium]|nr:hypothetical protein [Bacteroidales bacterium]
MSVSYLECSFCGTNNGNRYRDRYGNICVTEADSYPDFYRCSSCGVVLCRSCAYKVGKERSAHHVFSSSEHWVECPRCGGKLIHILSSKGQSSGSGCFITSATLKSLNKPDDCYELNLFRTFRDNWMKENHPEDIAQYYHIAPKIVDAIDKSDESASIYSSIWESYLKDCQSLIEQGNEEEAYTQYKQMVSDLIKDYYTD